MLSDAELREPFARWLAGRWPDAREIELGEFQSPKSGWSARTIFVPVRSERAGRAREEKLVFRLESPEPAVYPQQAPGLDVEIDLQYRVMESLGRAGALPLAPLIGYESDPSWVGTPFFAMGFIPGEVAIENPPYPSAGFFAQAAPEQRSECIRNGLRVLAEVHRVDYRAVGLDFLSHPAHEPGIARQIDLWAAFGRRELGERVHPLFDQALKWLRANPPRGLRNAFSWGDSRLGNIIFQGTKVACITDFENAAIAPPEFDLGWWLMFDRTMHEAMGVARPAGDLTREAQRDAYCEFAGRDVGPTHYYEVLAATRYCAIVVRVMNRMVDRGALPADNVIWRENPAATALAQLLEHC